MSRLTATLALVSAALFGAVTEPAAAQQPRKAIVWDQPAKEDPKYVELWIANPDGSAAHKLAAGYNADLSPDGRWVAYMLRKTGYYILALISTSGGQPLVLARDGWGFEFDWSSDSSRLAYSTSDADGFFVFDVGSGRTSLTIDSLTPFELAWVPNSTQIVVVSFSDLLLVNSVDGTMRQLGETPSLLTAGLLTTESTVAFYTYETADLSPDLLEGWYDTMRLYTVDLATGQRRSIARKMFPIAWKPGGRTLDVLRSDCVRRTCRFNAAAVDPATRAISGALPMGRERVRSRRQRGRKGGYRRRLTIIRSSQITPFATSSDGSSFLATKTRATGRAETYEDALNEVGAHVPVILRVPLSGARPTPIARGWSPDWNL